MTSDPAFYVAGGTLAPDAPSYLARAADTDLLEALTSGELCYVLNSRQLGKSSLCLRTRQALAKRGIRTAFLDLQKFGSSATPEQWFNSVLQRVGLDLKLRAEMLRYWRDNLERAPLDRLFGAITEVALAADDSPLVIFLDEVDVVRSLPFPTDEFFGAVRECFNQRAVDPVVRRLTFCLVGSALQADLVADTRLSPFNVGRQLDLRDFTLLELAPLGAALGPGGDALIERVHHWTGGQPFLTQSVCAALTAFDRVTTNTVDNVVADLYFTRSARRDVVHLADVSNRMLSRKAGEIDPADDRQKADILALYEQIWRGGKSVADDARNPLVGLLKLSGVVRSESGVLLVRNRIYERVFNDAWVAESRPDAEVRRQRAAVARGRRQVGGIAAAVLSVMIGLLILSVAATLDAKRQTSAANHMAYVSSIYLTSENSAADNFGLAQQFFDDAARLPKEERGFEWDYLAGRLHPVLLTLIGHTGPVTAVAFSPSGTRIVTGSSDNTARVWDVATGITEFTLAGHAGAVAAVAFSSDGRRIVTGSYDATAQVWDAATGRHLVTLTGHTGPVRTVAFSPDAARVITGSDDATARVWETGSGTQVMTLIGHNGPVYAVAFSRDGRQIATGGRDQTARLWNASDGAGLSVLSGHTGWVSSVAFSPDGKKLVTGSYDTTARIWDVGAGKTLVTLKGHAEAVRAVAFSPGGKRVVTGSDDSTARVWIAGTGQMVLPLKGHTGPVYAVAFSSDAKRIVTGSFDQTARIWAADPGGAVVTLRGHKRSVLSVAFSPDGKHIVTGSADGSAYVWDVDTGRRLLALKSHAGPVRSTAFSPDGTVVVTASSDKIVRICDAKTGRILWSRGNSVSVNSVAFSPDGKHIVIGLDDGAAYIWDIDAAVSPVTDYLFAETEPIYAVACSPDGRRVVAAIGDKSARVRDAKSGALIAEFLDHTGPVYTAAFSPSGKLVVTGSADNTARVWDANTGKPVATLAGHTAPVLSVAFSPDGKRIVTASADGTARVWDVGTGRELVSLKGHTGAINSAAFSPDGDGIVTGSEDRTARVWQKPTQNQRAAMEVEDAIAGLAAVPIADMSREAQALANRHPDQRARIATVLSQAAWAIVNPSKSQPTIATARAAQVVSQLAVDYSGGKDGQILHTLAAADCDCGELTAAVDAETRAVALSPRNPEFRSTMHRYRQAVSTGLNLHSQ